MTEKPTNENSRVFVTAWDAWQISIVFILVSLAAGLTWLLEMIPEFSWGQWERFAIIGLTALLELLRRWIDNIRNPIIAVSVAPKPKVAK